MLRDRFRQSLEDAMRARDSRAVSTLRLILAALKDRAIAARAQGRDEEISDSDIVSMLKTMVKQRQDSIIAYEKGGRLDLAEAEQEEIDVIEEFLPPPMTEAETQQAVATALTETGAQTLKDLGAIMALLRQRHSGRMDFALACQIAKARLSDSEASS